MRIYVGTYEKYNSGSIAGKWLDIDAMSKSEFYTKCEELHKDEKDPEFMFQDFENIPKNMIGESWVSDLVFEIAENVEEGDLEAFFEFLNAFGIDAENNDINELVDEFTDCYRGEHDTLKDYIEEMFDECYMPEVPESMRFYISYDLVYREHAHNYYFCNGHVFEQH